MGTKANAVTESVLSALIKEVGPHRFAVALHNVCCPGAVFEDSDLDLAFNDDHDDSARMLDAWNVGVERLIEVGRWIHKGTEPASQAVHSIEIPQCWEINTEDFEKLIFDTIGVSLAVKSEPSEAIHRFTVLTREKFVEDISDLLITGKKLCDLCIYIYRQTEMETVRGHSGNMLIRNAANLDTNKFNKANGK